MIQVAYLDDQPATRAGLAAILDAHGDTATAGSAADEQELWPMLHTCRPDVLLVDYHHPGHHALRLTRQISCSVTGPRVILHTSEASAQMAAAALLAGASAVVDKTAPERELLHTIRTVAAGESCTLAPADLGAAARVLEPEDQPILAMRAAGTEPPQIAQLLGVTDQELQKRVGQMIGALAPDRPQTDIDDARERVRLSLDPPLG